MKYKNTLTTILLAHSALIATFLWCVWQADKAMDKTGIGNLELSQQYNLYAGVTFWVVIALWITSILVAVIGKCFRERHAQIAIGFPPLLLVIGWFSLWFV